MRSNAPLTPQQLEAARRLVQGQTGIETARAVGVRPETISSWKRRPAFATELARLVEVAETGCTRERIEALVPKALDTLQQALTDSRTPIGIRVEAAAVVLATAATFEKPES